MPRSQDPQSRNLPISSCAHTLYQISTRFSNERSPMRLIEPLPIKPNVWAQAREERLSTDQRLSS